MDAKPINIALIVQKPVKWVCMRLDIATVFAEGSSITIQVHSSSTLSQVMDRLCRKGHMESKDLCFIHNGLILDDHLILDSLDLGEQRTLILSPRGISAGVDEQALADEYKYLREQFPLVRMVDLMTYIGRIRCERGLVKDLADRGIWPFTEYVKWHEFKMELSYLHPYKPPKVTWLTDISHPNIIPAKKGKVCVSILGKKWLPNTKLAAVVNALYFLLSDPNPYSAYPNKRCKEVAVICRMFGFPIKRTQTAAEPQVFTPE
jgi:hypothetical protein